MVPVRLAVMRPIAPAETERLRQQVSFEFNCVELWKNRTWPCCRLPLGAGALGLRTYV